MVTYRLTEGRIPAYLDIDGRTTPVWRQQRFLDRPHGETVRRSGCGHCCTAMALQLHGVDLDPHDEYEYCLRLWGEPQDHQGRYLSVGGITAVLRSFGVAANCFGVDDPARATQHILSALAEGRQVIFWSAPSPDFPDNPFSRGSHYVMAIGFDEAGLVLVANSSERWGAPPVQHVTADTIRRALFDGCTADKAKTWAEPADHRGCAGYVIVG